MKLIFIDHKRPNKRIKYINHEDQLNLKHPIRLILNI